jgi:DNA-binding NtrC family response regulator
MWLCNLGSERPQGSFDFPLAVRQREQAMTVKRLICISHQGGSAVRDKCGALSGWDVCTVSSLHEANRVLETQRFMVGLLLDFITAGSSAESDLFLRRHANVQWVGVLERSMLDHPEWRSLVTDHLCDFHTTPLDPARLHHTLGHAHGWAMLRERAVRQGDPGAINTIHGDSAAIVALRAQIRKVAPVNAPVLIWGESGSGKELAAQAIHAHSPRANGPFVPINCGALPPSLIQSELFGYERGSFTGAAKSKAGLIESAAGGTIFLDEIGDLPKEIQSNLLRFLQERTITRIGATREITVDARVIAASHVNLKHAVAQGLFREDLYYRLNVLPIEVPPLRERIADLPFLAEHFFQAYSAEKGAHVKGFSSKALRAMEQHDWPGNVRELINCIRRAMVLADGRLITPADLNLAEEASIFNGDALVESRVRAERDAICVSLANAGKNVTHAARDLGVSRMTLYRLLAKHNITV